MSLDFDLTRIKNCDVEASEIKPFSTLWILIFGSMMIGIDSITDKNYKEVYNRYKYACNVGYSGKMDLKDIKKYIGLSTNADNLTLNEFIFKIAISKYIEIDKTLKGTRLKNIQTYNVWDKYK
jgi:hypothetical protein